MKILLDTNILLRLTQKSSEHHLVATACFQRLGDSGHTFCIGSQSVAEFLAVATRPQANQGLGMSPTEAEASLSSLTSALEFLYDSPDVVAELRRLVVGYNVIGKSIHDAKLVAAMVTNQVKQIVTFNVRDFARYKEITIVDPRTMSAS
jgi:predicted nucleic acid-binding protein